MIPLTTADRRALAKHAEILREYPVPSPRIQALLQQQRAALSPAAAVMCDQLIESGELTSLTGFSLLVGCHLIRIDAVRDSSKIIIELRYVTTTGTLVQNHQQDCCETVEVSDIDGDLSDVADSAVVLAEESVSPPLPEAKESETWTLYRLRTTKGDLTIRWLGSSNGYYSESVDCVWVDDIGEGG